MSARILNAADHGAATTRQRLFVLGVRGRSNPRWPEPTHSKSSGDLFSDLKPWRAAKEIIDWKKQGKPVFGRERPLARKTIERILAGIRKFSGEAFVLGQQSGSVPRSVEHPLPTIATDGAISLCEPFLIQYHGRSQVYSVREPLRTVDTRDRYALIEVKGVPTLVQAYLRMLEPGELAAAMSFPSGYQFKGSKADVIKQIGNAVDVSQARALCRSQIVA